MFASRQAPERDRARIARRRGRELEPTFEKRCRRLADDDGLELIEPRERLDRRPRRTFAFQIDRRNSLMLPHQRLGDVNHDLRVRFRAVVALCAFACLQDHQRGQRGPDRRILDHVQAEGGHECAAAKLHDLAAERLDFPDHLIEGPARVDDVHTEQRHAPLLPGGPRARDARDLYIGRRNRWRIAPDPTAPSRHAGRGPGGGTESEARHAGKDGVPRDAEAHRRLRDVPARLREHLEQVRAHLLTGRLRRRRLCLARVIDRGRHWQREHGSGHDRFVGEQYGAFDHVAELSHVARPVVRGQRRPRITGECLGRQTVVGARA